MPSGRSSTTRCSSATSSATSRCSRSGRSAKRWRPSPPRPSRRWLGSTTDGSTVRTHPRLRRGDDRAGRSRLHCPSKRTGRRGVPRAHRVTAGVRRHFAGPRRVPRVCAPCRGLCRRGGRRRRARASPVRGAARPGAVDGHRRHGDGGTWKRRSGCRPTASRLRPRGFRRLRRSLRTVLPIPDPSRRSACPVRRPRRRRRGAGERPAKAAIPHTNTWNRATSWRVHGWPRQVVGVTEARKLSGEAAEFARSHGQLAREVLGAADVGPVRGRDESAPTRRTGDQGRRAPGHRWRRATHTRLPPMTPARWMPCLMTSRRWATSWPPPMPRPRPARPTGSRANAAVRSPQRPRRPARQGVWRCDQPRPRRRSGATTVHAPRTRNREDALRWADQPRHRGADLAVDPHRRRTHLPGQRKGRRVVAVRTVGLGSAVQRGLAERQNQVVRSSSAPKSK